MSPYERMQLSRIEEEKRSKLVAEFAQKQGLVMIEVSPRRSIVARVNGRHQFTAVIGEPLQYCNLNAVLVFGPATWQECQNWIVDNGEKMPDELCRK